MPGKYTRFRDVPQLIRNTGYAVDLPWNHLERALDQWRSEDGHEVDLDPDFQRGHVWTEAQQIAFVEFGMRGGTSARRIYFNSVDFEGCAPVVLVDGKQRLEAVLRFLHDEIPAFGTLYSEYEDGIAMAEKGTSFRICVNRLKTRAEVLTWYLQINEGGVVHTKDELARVKELLAKENGK